MFDDLNRTRVSDGLHPLAWDEKLTDLARQHALDMARRNYYSHTSPEGLSPFDRMRAAGALAAYAGENIAESEDESSAELALLNSPEHRDNMLDNHYGHVGIGVAVTPDGAMLFVEDFSS